MDALRAQWMHCASVILPRRQTGEGAALHAAAAAAAAGICCAGWQGSSAVGRGRGRGRHGRRSVWHIANEHHRQACMFWRLGRHDPLGPRCCSDTRDLRRILAAVFLWWAQLGAVCVLFVPRCCSPCQVLIHARHVHVCAAIRLGFVLCACCCGQPASCQAVRICMRVVAASSTAFFNCARCSNFTVRTGACL